MYATKRRRRNVKPLKSPPKEPTKSNPSKRHRERLNSELELLASLLPFEQSVIAKLDKLSILRLAVSYLRTKSYFAAVLNDRFTVDNQLHRRLHQRIHHSPRLCSELGFTDTTTVLQALSGFLFVVSCDGEVFYASHTVEQYLGFHQSDIIHQSALELIHSEDRENFKSQLNWQCQLTAETSEFGLEQVLLPDNNHLLQRCFTARFRCLLDNASGFITLEISGKIRPLMGQSTRGKPPPLALFALCCPFGPLPLPDVPWRDYTFKTKHRMDLSLLSMDARGKQVFEYTDRELAEKGGYDLIHPDDLSYYASGHQELIKTGSAGLIAYRLMTKDMDWIWLQTSARVIYKNSKPEFILATHRHLTEDEGRDLFRKRGSEFKLPYPIIDLDLTEFESGLLPAVDTSATAADVPTKPVSVPSATTATSKKATKARNGENRKRKSQPLTTGATAAATSYMDLTSGGSALPGSHVVRGCSSTTPAMVSHFKTEVMNSPGAASRLTAAAAGCNGFDSDLYRGAAAAAAAAAAAGYPQVLAAAATTDNALQSFGRFYLDQYCVPGPPMTNAVDQFMPTGADIVSSAYPSGSHIADVMNGDMAYDVRGSSRYVTGSETVGYRLNELYSSPFVGGSGIVSSRYQPISCDVSLFDSTVRPTLPPATDWTPLGLFDAAHLLGSTSSCWYKPPGPATAVSGVGMGSLSSSSSGHPSSYNQNPAAAAAAAITGFYGVQPVRQDDTGDVLQTARRTASTASSDFARKCNVLNSGVANGGNAGVISTAKSIDSVSTNDCYNEMASPTTGTSAITAKSAASCYLLGGSGSGNVGGVYDSRLLTPPEDDVQPPSFTSAVGDMCRQKATAWSGAVSDDQGDYVSTGNVGSGGGLMSATSSKTGCSFGVATPVIQLTGRKNYCTKPSVTSSTPAGIAVPVVKSSSWFQSATAGGSWYPSSTNRSYSGYQRLLTGGVDNTSNCFGESW